MNTRNAHRSTDSVACVTVEAIDMLTHDQRIALREKLEGLGHKRLPRNLYFDYKSQEWIGFDRETDRAIARVAQ